MQDDAFQLHFNQIFFGISSKPTTKIEHENEELKIATWNYQPHKFQINSF
jgi:hypothetical protein